MKCLNNAVFICEMWQFKLQVPQVVVSYVKTVLQHVHYSSCMPGKEELWFGSLKKLGLESAYMSGYSDVACVFSVHLTSAPKEKG